MTGFINPRIYFLPWSEVAGLTDAKNTAKFFSINSNSIILNTINNMSSMVFHKSKGRDKQLANEIVKEQLEPISLPAYGIQSLMNISLSAVST